jgi:hypothetical protein
VPPEQYCVEVLSFAVQLTFNEPEQLAVKPLDVPQVAVTPILLYVPCTGLLQFGAFADQAISVAIFPLLQVKAGGATATSESPLSRTEPQVSVAVTVSEPLQLAVKPLDVPQVAVTPILLYVPCTGLLQFGAFADQAISDGVFPLLQVKAGGVISAPSYPEPGTLPQVSVAGLTFNVPQETAGEIPCPQSAAASTS